MLEFYGKLDSFQITLYGNNAAIRNAVIALRKEMKRHREKEFIFHIKNIEAIISIGVFSVILTGIIYYIITN